MNLLGKAVKVSMKNRNMEDIRLEETAAMYMIWLIAPASAEIGRRLAWKILKNAKFEIKKAARAVSRHCQSMDKKIAGDNGGTEILEIYDGLLDSYREEMKNEEFNIMACALEHYEGYKEKEILAEILFAFSITKIHRAIVLYENKKLGRMQSILDISLAEKSLSTLVNLLAKLGYEYEKKCGVREKVYDSELLNDVELAVVGFKDVLTDYYDRLLSDTDMHARIQRPLIEFENNRSVEAEALGNEILSRSIDELCVESPVFERYNMKIIQDLYTEKGLRTDLDWNDEEKEVIVKALQVYIKKEVLNYV